MPVDHQDEMENSIDPIELEKAEDYFWTHLAKNSEDEIGLEIYLAEHFNQLA